MKSWQLTGWNQHTSFHLRLEKISIASVGNFFICKTICSLLSFISFMCENLTSRFQNISVYDLYLLKESDTGWQSVKCLFRVQVTVES